MAIKKIICKFITELNELLVEKDLKIRLTEEAIKHIADVGYDPKMGARPLQRTINNLIKIPLSKKLIFESVEPNHIIIVDYVNDEIIFNVKSTEVDFDQPKVNNDGYIILDQFKPKS